jgi:hypothetical protein
MIDEGDIPSIQCKMSVRVPRSMMSQYFLKDFPSAGIHRKVFQENVILTMSKSLILT